MRSRADLFRFGAVVALLQAATPAHSQSIAGGAASPGKGLPNLEAWKAPEPAPVHFYGKVLFYVRGGVANLSPQARAQRIEGRLRAVANAGPPGAVRVEEGYFSDIYVGDRFIASITDEEAGGSGPKRVAWAQLVAEEIGEALKRYQEERSPPALLRSATKAAVSTAALIVFLIALRWARRKLAPRVTHAFEAVLRRARIQGLELLTPAAQKRLIAVGGRLLHIGLIAIAFFVWFQVVGHLFPWTRDPSDRALRIVGDAGGSVGVRVVRFLPNLIYIAFFALVGYGANRLNATFFRAVERGAIRLPNFYPDWSSTTSRLVSVLIYGLLAVAIYPYLPGSGSSAFQAIGIFFGAMISLGSGSSVANAISGVVLTYMRPFAVGDFVRIANTNGTVQHQSVLAVRLLTIRNESVTIPASMVLSGQITNYSTQSQSMGVAIATSVTIGYGTPWRRVHELLLAAADKTSHVLEKPKPWVIQAELSDFYVRYELDAYIDDPSRQHFILSDLNQNVQDLFSQAGVEILSPHYAQLRDGNKPAIPDEWLPPGRDEETFRVTATLREAPGVSSSETLGNPSPRAEVEGKKS